MLPGDGVRVDIAFETAPDDPFPKYVDVTGKTLMSPGIGITRGRSPEGGAVTPGTCSLTLVNDDGRFTAENPASPYYPNVTLYRRLRVSWRDPATLGARNLLAAEDASFEAGTVGAWAGVAGATPTSSAVRAWDGVKSMLVTWPTASFTNVQLPVRRFRVGVTYTVGVYVYVPTGSPNVFLSAFGVANGAATAVKDAWARITVTFTATNESHLLQVWSATAATAGQQVWVDAAQLDEGSTLGAFTTSAPSVDELVDRYVGFVDSWPTVWPSGPDRSRAAITATDRFKRIGRRRQLRSIIEEEFLLDAPSAYFPGGEPEGSTSAGDQSGVGIAANLATNQYGAGGTIAFGAGTGPGTDSLTAPVLTPVNPTNGKTLLVTATGSFNFYTDVLSAECFVSTTATSVAILEVREPFGRRIAIEISATGKARLVADGTPSGDLLELVDSASNLNTGATRHVAFTAQGNAAGATMRLWVDGVNVATLPTTGLAFRNLPGMNILEVGGRSGALLTGTISHVAVYGNVALSSTRIAAHSLAGSTGFSGERSDQRVARYATYSGVSVADMNLDVGASTSIAHVDTTAQNALSLAQQVEQTESGVLFVDRSGLLRFHARTRRYNAAAVALTADKLRPDVGLDFNDQGVVNDVTASRPNGTTYRATSAESIAQFGDVTESIELLTTSDSEVIDAANWRVQTKATPRSRIPAVSIDVLAANAATRAIALALEISSRVGLSSLPSQAGSSTSDGFVEGYSEQITDNAWTLALNTSPADKGRVWQLGVAGSSELGTTTRLTY